MTPDDLDRILSSDDALEPSSGFLKNVMAAAQELPDIPPPTFPWRRFLAGQAALMVMAAAGTPLLEKWGAGLTPLAARLAPLAAIAPEFGCAVAATLVAVGVAAIPWLLARS